MTTPDEVRLRPAGVEDVNFLVWIDIKDEGVSSTYMANWTDADWADHREKIAGFVSASDKIAVVAECGEGRRVGGAYARLRRQADKLDYPTSISLCEDLPSDDLYCEMYQLWVDPEVRRKGLASALKLAVEIEAANRGAGFICTATEATNLGVIELNEKLGYRIGRVGALWDDIPRVSLLKDLSPNPSARSSHPAD